MPPLTKEQEAAWRLASIATAGVATDLAKFSGWLMAALGGVLTIFVTSHDSVTELFESANIRISLSFFSASMLFGLLAQWLVVPIRAGLAFSTEGLTLKTQGLDSTKFINEFSSLLILPYRCLFVYKLAKKERVDELSPIRSPARLSQYVSILILFQYFAVIAVVVALAIGVKV